MEVGDAVLCEEADEVQTTEGVFARRWREYGAEEGVKSRCGSYFGALWPIIPVVVVKCEELREIAVERGDILRSYTPERADFEDVTCKGHQLVFGLKAGRVRMSLTSNNKVLRIGVAKGHQQARLSEANLDDTQFV